MVGDGNSFRIGNMNVFDGFFLSGCYGVNCVLIYYLIYFEK